MKTNIVISLVISTVLLTSYAFAQHAGQGNDALLKFEKMLDNDGFIMTPGKTEVLDWAQEYCDGILPNAGYVNKVPYLRLRVPITARNPQTTQNPELVDSFQLKGDEAIVLIGQNPPPVSYFGYYGFLWTKSYPAGSYAPTGISSQPIEITLGDPINNATVNTIGPTPFNAPVAVIFTPDQGTDARIRSALQKAGYPAAIMNTYVLPASMLNLGYGEKADAFRIVMRTGKWDDPDAGKAYLQNAPGTLKVFRITPRTPAISSPFPAPPLRVRGTGQTEMRWMNKQGELRKNIIDDPRNAGLYAVDIPTKPNWYEGYDYLQQGINAGSDVRDALLFTAGWLPEYDSFEKITLADDEFLMVYGVNHIATGKATYMSINAYASWEAKLSIGQVFENDLRDTAAPYFPAGDPAAKVMYAYKVSRNCGGEPNCLPLAIDFNCPPLAIDANTILALIFRNYLEAATKTGPAMQEILYDRIIKFSPRPPQPPQP